MGNMIGKAMEDSMRKNQDFMLETQLVMLERQIQMQDQMRQRMAAQQIARTREMFTWLSTFYLLATIGMVKSYRRTKNPMSLGPFLPLTFIVGYQGDMAYGGKMKRITAEAEDIMTYEANMLRAPLGMPSVSVLDEERFKQKEDPKPEK